MQSNYLPEQEHMLHRQRITELLNESLNHSIISVTAPQGYGKTLALADFCRQTEHAVIWMHCVSLDNDPIQFWRSFTEAGMHEFPDSFHVVKSLDFPLANNDFHNFISIFGEILAKQKVIVVFDNAEHLSAKPIVSFIRTLVELELYNLCIIISRNQPIARKLYLPSSSRYHIGYRILRFTGEEIRSLSEQYGLNLSDNDIVKINHEVTSWPLALHLLFMEMRHGEDDYRNCTVWRQIIFELFEHHYYINYPVEIRMQLIALSLLPYVSVALIRGIEETVTEESIMTLTSISFIHYNSDSQVCVIHRLYQSFLQGKQNIFPKSKIHDLMDKSGKWYTENGRAHDALFCFEFNHDYDNYIKAISFLPGVWQDVKTSQQIIQTLSEMPVEYRCQNLLVDYIRAFMHLNNMQVKLAKQIFHEVLIHMNDQEEDKMLLGNTFLALADISNILNTTEGLCYIKKAHALLPNGTQIFSRELLVVRNNNIFFLPDNDAGRLEEMIAYQFDFSSFSDPLTNGSKVGYDLLFAAEACFFSGQFVRSIEYAQRTIYKAKMEKQYDIVCNALFIKIRISMYHGDIDSAVNYLNEIIDYAQNLELDILYKIRDSVKFWLNIQLGHFEKAETDLQLLIDNKSIHPGRIHIILASYYLSQQQFHETLILLSELDGFIAERGLWVASIYAHLYKAVCYLMLNRKELAIDELWLSYDKVYRNDIWFIFVELEKIMLLLLDAAKNQTRYQFDRQWIDRIYQEASAAAIKNQALRKMVKEHKSVRHGSSVSLSEREDETLFHLSNGLTQKEIASNMNISVNGVKRHITNIYTKLGAKNRVEAIYIATANGLLKQPDSGELDSF